MDRFREMQELMAQTATPADVQARYSADLTRLRGENPGRFVAYRQLDDAGTLALLGVGETRGEVQRRLDALPPDVAEQALVVYAPCARGAAGPAVVPFDRLPARSA